MSSSTSSVTSATTVGGTTRITGLSSGIDVDSIVEQLMATKKAKLNSLKQKQQLAEWRQEQYRSIIADIQEFADKYFNTAASISMLSKSYYKVYNASSDSSAVSVKAGASAAAGSHTLTVSQLATAATLTSSGSLSKDVQGATAADYESAQGKSFIINLDGAGRTITLDDTVEDADDLQTAIDAAVGAGKVEVTADESGVITIAAAEGSGVQKITLSSSSNSALSALGFGDGAVLTNRISTSDTLETIAGQLNTALTFNDDGQIELTINGVNFTFDKADKLSEVISEINDSDAGATLSYDELSGKLALTADETGAGATLVVTEGDGSNFLAACLSQSTAGQDAKLALDGTHLTRSSNTVTVDGITYTLNKVTADQVTVSVEQDVDAIYDNLSNFVDAYNELIETINAKLSESYDSDYPPLTDDQKAEMSEDEIANWEEKAQTGLLSRDSVLQDFVGDLRSALVDSVSGLTTSLSKIGITTGTYDEQGKLYINETTLKEAIANDPDGVTNLFCQQSLSYFGTTIVRKLNSSELKTRYKEEGIAYRIYDVLQANISTLRDNNGNKGLLLEKAGKTGDGTETENVLTKQIADYQERIEKEEDRLDEEEARLYTQYTSLETYINTLNAQLTAFQNLFSSLSGS